MVRKNGVKIILVLLALFSLIFGFSLHAQHVAVTGQQYVPSLWLAGSDGIIKVSASDCSVMLQRKAPNLRAVAVDGTSGRIWTYGEGKLYAYGLDGACLLSVSIHTPGGDCDEEGSALSVDPATGCVWLGVSKSLFHIDSQGNVGPRLPLTHPIRALARDSVQSRLWVATQKSVFACNEAGIETLAISLPRHIQVKDIAFDPSSNVLLLALDDSLQSYGPNANLFLEQRYQDIEHIATDGKGSEWVAGDKSLARVDSSGRIRFFVEDLEKKVQGTVAGIAADPTDGSVWLIDVKNLIHVSGDGAILKVTDFKPVVKGRLWDIDIYRDTNPPAINITSPVEGSFIHTASPTVELTYSDLGSGVDPSTLAVKANGQSTQASCTHKATGAACTPASSLFEGENTLEATVKDYEGNTSSASQVSFTVDTLLPSITISSPSEGILTNQPAQILTGKISEAADLTVDGKPVSVDGAGGFSVAVTLATGLNTFTLIATDKAGNKGESAISLTLDTIPPVITVTTPADGLYTNQAAQTICGQLSETADLTLNGQPVQVGAGGSFALAITLEVGQNTLFFSGVDKAGNVGEATIHLTLDITPPQITLSSPVDGLLTNRPTQTVTGHLSEAASLKLNGQPVTVEPDESFSFDWTLGEGANPLLFSAVDQAGNTGELTLTLTLDTTPPAAPNTSLITVGRSVGGEVTLEGGSGSVEPGALVSISNQGSGTAVSTHAAPSGSFSARIAAQAGDSLIITATDPAGNAGAGATVSVPNSLPPPALSIPEGSFGETYRDLVPQDATISRYDPRRFSLVTGSVKDISGAPLGGVGLSILSHPEYGTARTDAEGRFSLPLEGGGNYCIVFKKEGFITSHRQVDVSWNDIAIVEALRMIREDTASTLVTFDGNPQTVITHSSTPVSDSSGSRSCSLVFTGDNQAWSVDAAGNVIGSLPAITTRATEYTTPESMPAKLPPNSAFTYCTELQVDGAERVRFQKPVVVYVDNFLGFPVGETVPVGYYDRDKGIWIPSDSGRVVRLLDINRDGIVDALDVTGSGQPTDFNGNRSFEDEVKGLNDPSRYRPGTTYWRFEVSHFTSWDPNWGFSPPQNAIAPTGLCRADQQKAKQKDCLGANASFVEERSRILHEDIPVPGTDLTLHYAGNRVKDYHHRISIPVSNATVPSSLKSIIVKAEIVGKTFERTLDPIPNQQTEFSWDGLDYLGNPVIGRITVHAQIGYTYDGVYQQTSRFGYSGNGTLITGSRTRQEVTLWQSIDMIINTDNALGKGEQDKWQVALGDGWTISKHHYLSPSDPVTLYRGDGLSVTNHVPIITKVAGDGCSSPFREEGGPAIEARLCGPSGVAVDAKGNLYIADYGNNRIRKVDRSGIITTLNVIDEDVGQWVWDAGQEDWVWVPDNGPQLNGPSAVAVDGTGSIYVADSLNFRVLKVDTNGNTTTVAGNGTKGNKGTWGPATETPLNGPSAVAVDAAGNIYIAEYLVDPAQYEAWGFCSILVHKVDTSGFISTIVSLQYNWEPSCGWWDYPPLPSLGPLAIAVDKTGNLYIALHRENRVVKIDTSGSVINVAGQRCGGYSGDGGPARGAELYGPSAVAVDAAGDIYIADSLNGRIRKVDASGIITTVAGFGDAVKGGEDWWGYGGDGGPPASAQFMSPSALALDPVGDLYIADSRSSRLKFVPPLRP